MNSLTATVNAARRIFSPRASRVGRSNSPGPWIVMLKGMPDRTRGEHRHRGRSFPDVVVQVLDPLGPKPLGEVGGFDAGRPAARAVPSALACRSGPRAAPRPARVEATGGSSGTRPAPAVRHPPRVMNSVAACSRRISSLTSSRGSGRRIEKVWTVKPRTRNCATSPRMNESLARA